MAKTNNEIDEEPTGSDQPSLKESSQTKRNRAYQKLHRDLSEEELNNSGTQKMLLSDLDRLEAEVEELKDYRNQFHQKDKQNAVIEEQLKSSVSKEILYAVSISLGATLIGLSASIWSDTNHFGGIILSCGIVLIIAGLITKFFWK